MNGEAPMILSYSTSPAYHMAVDNTDRYQAARFEEGHYLQVEVAALGKSSKDQALGREFMEVMLSPADQGQMRVRKVMDPASDLGDELPEVFDRLIHPSQALFLEPAEVARQRRSLVTAWLDAMPR